MSGYGVNAIKLLHIMLPLIYDQHIPEASARTFPIVSNKPTSNNVYKLGMYHNF